MDEILLEHLIKDVTGVGETLIWKHKLGLVRPTTRLISHQKVNYNLSQANLQLINKKL